MKKNFRQTKRGTLVAAPALALALGVAPTVRGQTFSDWSEPISLGTVLNTGATDGCPFISKNGLSLYFASNRPGGLGGLDIYVSQRPSIDVPWGPPQNLGPSVNSAANELCPTLTIDGHRLFYVSDRAGGCGGQDLYVARRRDRRDDFAWGPPQNLGCTVNSAENDFTPSYLEDRLTGVAVLYFSSNRAGGPGGTDIYVSTQGADGSFGAAALVEELSTLFNDQRPNVRKDGLEIFFDSDRQGSLGSTDLWSSTRGTTSDSWSPPLSLGSVVNSAALDGRPSLSFHGRTLYFMSSRPGSTPSSTGSPSIDLYVTTRKKLRDREE
jgi:Tol biopolymer transport system component